MQGNELLSRLNSDKASGVFANLYSAEQVKAVRLRYSSLIEGFMRDEPGCFPRSEFPEAGGDLRIFSAPGRTELCGNHTDHNNGKVLAASIQLDSAAVAASRRDMKVFFRSTGHRDVTVDLSDLSVQPNEKGDSEALIRGIAAGFCEKGMNIGGFSANADSRVFSGSGLSSSAAMEVLLGRIFDCLFNSGKTSALELAQIGQKAENVYFGKPCGLMDQVACAAGGAVAIDFKDKLNPGVKQVEFQLTSLDTALCVVNTGGNHASLVEDYAAIPNEMKAVAAVFGKTILRDVDRQMVLDNAKEIRKKAGDRALLRALHFFNENRRVDAMLSALEDMNNNPLPEHRQRALDVILEQVNESGDSSWELLQNIFPPHNPKEQGISLALTLTRDFITACCANRGACRVHGGGFAGTIQAYIPMNALEEYRKFMEGFFGTDSVTVLTIRPAGAVELKF